VLSSGSSGARSGWPIDSAVRTQSSRDMAAAALCSAVGPAADPEPTRERPGTDGKIRVLAARVAAGQRLWHPRDAGMGGGGPS
jgi:hypothetical protein